MKSKSGLSFVTGLLEVSQARWRQNAVAIVSFIRHISLKIAAVTVPGASITDILCLLIGFSKRI